MSVLPYFNYRDEITVQDGVLLRGERVIIPKVLRSGIVHKVHAGHSGINSCLRRARELIFWPGMSADIRQYVETCDVCSSLPNRQAPEPLYMHDTPDRPWKKVGTDMFTICQRDYLVTVDYFSQFIEIDYLPVADTETIVHKLKSHFARYGIPETLISDNGPQFTSGQFRQFTKAWNVTHETSSPGNSKANGAAEAAVKTAKHMMKRSLKAKENMYLGLLNIRNTPQEGLTTSPAQRLMGRRTATLVPTCDSLLKPKGYSLEKELRLMEDKRSGVAERYQNRTSLRPLRVGETVRMQPIDNRTQEWKEAVVTKRLKSRTYEVESGEGKRYRRNRQFIRPSRVRASNATTQRESSDHGGGGQVAGPIPDEVDQKMRGNEVTLVARNNNCGSEPGDKLVEMETVRPTNGHELIGTKYKTRSGREVTAPKRLDL